MNEGLTRLQRIQAFGLLEVDDLEWLINTIKKQQKELSLLCPIGDMSVIESLKVEKLQMMERMQELEQEIENLWEVINTLQLKDSDFE